jgi:DNA-binding CsgD family transcriptional regulator
VIRRNIPAAHNPEASGGSHRWNIWFRTWTLNGDTLPTEVVPTSPNGAGTAELTYAFGFPSNVVTLSVTDHKSKVVTCKFIKVIVLLNREPRPTLDPLPELEDECTVTIESVNIKDVTPPVITCPDKEYITIAWNPSYGPEETVVELVTDPMTGDVTRVDTTLGSATATDNCGDPVVTYEDLIINEFCPTIIWREWTATDGALPDAGPNIATCLQVITVENLFARKVDTHKPIDVFRTQTVDTHGPTLSWKQLRMLVTPMAAGGGQAARSAYGAMRTTLIPVERSPLYTAIGTQLEWLHQPENNKMSLQVVQSKPLDEMQGPGRRDGSFAHPPLTDCELRILKLIGEGESKPMIGIKLRLSPDALGAEIVWMREMLQIGTDAELACFAANLIK